MKSIHLVAEFVCLATSAECAGPINRPTELKWLTTLKQIKRLKLIPTPKITPSDWVIESA